MTKICISFSWIGPPAQLNGHDTDGPDQFIKRFHSSSFSNSTHELSFFCLKKYEAHYKAHFQRQPIQIHAVEEYLQKVLSSSDDPAVLTRAQELLSLMNVLLSSERDSIRDRVTLKNQLHYFLGYYQGGYLFDTNIKPARDFRTLKCLNEFTIVSLCGLKKPAELRDIDVYAFYSPVKNELIKDVFDTHLEGLKFIEAIHLNKRAQAYYLDIAFNLMSTMFESWRIHGGSYWISIKISPKSDAIPSLGVIKEQENTHKYELRKTYDREMELIDAVLNHGLFKGTLLAGFPRRISQLILQYVDKEEREQLHHQLTGFRLPHHSYHDIFFQIEGKNYEKVQEYLNNGFDLQTQVTITEPNSRMIKNETILHFAIRRGYPKAVKIILDTPGASDILDVGAQYEQEGLCYTPLLLAEAFREDLIAKLIRQKITDLASEKKGQIL
jgi:hypothetical protein